MPTNQELGIYVHGEKVTQSPVHGGLVPVHGGISPVHGSPNSSAPVTPATLDPLNKTAVAVLSNGNLRLTNSDAGGFVAAACSTTSKTTGRYQVNVTMNTLAGSEGGRVGFVETAFTQQGGVFRPGDANNSIGFDLPGSGRNVNVEGAAQIDMGQGAPTNGSWPPGALTAGETLCVIIDIDAQKCYVCQGDGTFYGNGSGTTMNPATGAGGIPVTFTSPVKFIAAISRQSDITINFNPSTLYGGAQAWG